METQSNYNAYNQQQELVRLAKKQLFWQRLIALLLLALVAGVVVLAVVAGPRVALLAERLGAVEEMAQSVGSQVVEAANALKEASEGLQKLDQMDVEAFNEAMRSLREINSSFAAIFGR